MNDVNIKISVRSDFMNTKKSKKTAIEMISAMLIIILAISAISVISPYANYEHYKKSQKFLLYLDDSEVETLRHVMNLSEIKQANSIVGDIITALSYSGSRADCDITGPLIRFCRFTDDYDYTSVESTVNLITYKKTDDTGYLWIKYSHKHRGENDIVVTGAIDVLCLIKVKDTPDGYEITDILEGP